MHIPKEVLSSVFFVCYKDKNRELKYAGTAFLLQDELDTNLGLAHSVTVTARHVIRAIERNSVDGKVLLRINPKEGEAEFIETDVSEWIHHSDSLYPTDVSILYAAPDQQYDVTSVSTSIIANEQDIENGIVGIGAEVFIVGLFVNHTGKHRNIPILRTGNIAMMPGELVKTNDFGDIEAYLIESRSIGGLSGSPVYCYRESLIASTDGVLQFVKIFRLVGLIHGHYSVAQPQKDTLVGDSAYFDEAINVGIAIVIPASKIIETINQPEIVKRKELERKALLSRMLNRGTS